MNEIAAKIKTDQARRTLDGYRFERAKPVSVLIYRRLDSGDLEGRVIYTECTSLEAVKAKMLQYPPGTTFKLDSRSNEAGAAIEKWAKENGLPLEK